MPQGKSASGMLPSHVPTTHRARSPPRGRGSAAAWRGSGTMPSLRGWHRSKSTGMAGTRAAALACSCRLLMGAPVRHHLVQVHRRGHHLHCPPLQNCDPCAGASTVTASTAWSHDESTSPAWCLQRRLGAPHLCHELAVDRDAGAAVVVEAVAVAALLVGIQVDAAGLGRPVPDEVQPLV